MSNFFITFLIGIVSLNILITIIMIFRPFLEKKMSMIYLNYLLKCVIVFSAVIAPVLLFIISYKLNYHYRVYVENPDIDYYEIWHHTTIGDTYIKNHWIFLLLFVVWGIGIIIHGILKSFKDYRLLKKLEKYSNNNLDLCELNDCLCNNFKIKGSVAILSNDMIQSPFMVGIFKKKIFIPNANFTPSEWELLLKHELIHCKKNDFIFRRFVFALCSVYWFNPFIYKLANYYIEVNEMACDETVLKHQPANIRTVYGTLIIDMYEEGNGLNAVSLTGHAVNGLERRIKNIMRKSMKTKKLLFASILLAIILMMPLTTYAVTYAVDKIQYWTVYNLIYETTEVPPDGTGPLIIEPFISTDIVDNPIHINTEGQTLVDLTIEGGKVTKLGSIKSSDNSISFVFVNFGVSDSFRIGLVTPNKEKIYVESVNGSVNCRFDKLELGECWVFIEVPTEESTHIMGTIFIEPSK